jgi:hypothetical protein
VGGEQDKEVVAVEIRFSIHRPSLAFQIAQGNLLAGYVDSTATSVQDVPKGLPFAASQSRSGVRKEFRETAEHSTKARRFHAVVDWDGAVHNRRVLACDNEANRVGVIVGVIAHGGVPRCSVFVSEAERGADPDLVLEGSLVEARWTLKEEVRGGQTRLGFHGVLGLGEQRALVVQPEGGRVPRDDAMTDLMPLGESLSRFGESAIDKDGALPEQDRSKQSFDQMRSANMQPGGQLADVDDFGNVHRAGDIVQWRWENVYDTGGAQRGFGSAEDLATLQIVDDPRVQGFSFLISSMNSITLRS